MYFREKSHKGSYLNISIPHMVIIRYDNNFFLCFIPNKPALIFYISNHSKMSLPRLQSILNTVLYQIENLLSIYVLHNNLECHLFLVPILPISLS